MQQVNPRFARLNNTQVQDQPQPQKKQKLSTQASAAPMAAPARGRGIFSGGPSSRGRGAHLAPTAPAASSQSIRGGRTGNGVSSLGDGCSGAAISGKPPPRCKPEDYTTLTKFKFSGAISA